MEICFSSSKLTASRIVLKSGNVKIFYPKCCLRVIIKAKVEVDLEVTPQVKEASHLLQLLLVTLTKIDLVTQDMIIILVVEQECTINTLILEMVYSVGTKVIRV